MFQGQLWQEGVEFLTKTVYFVLYDPEGVDREVTENTKVGEDFETKEVAAGNDDEEGELLEIVNIFIVPQDTK